MLIEKIKFEVDKLAISGRLYLPGIEGKFPTVCVCHGIPARTTAPDDKGYPLFAEKLCRQGFAVLIFNFRGCGESEGNFDILGWTKDLKGAIDYLTGVPAVDGSHLALLGFSGGAAVSVHVAAFDKRITSLAACACPSEFNMFGGDPSPIIEHFRSIGIIRDEDFPEEPHRWQDNFRLVKPIEYVAQISPRPLLILHGRDDETVNVSHAYRLYESAGEPKEIVITSGAGHRLRLNENAMSIAINWLQKQNNF